MELEATAAADADAAARKVPGLVDRIGTLLHGQGQMAQGAALADLLAMWLAGHFVPDDPVATTRLRAELLDMHVRLVRDLIRPSAQAIAERTGIDVPE
jgi:hypothetical protein